MKELLVDICLDITLNISSDNKVNVILEIEKMVENGSTDSLVIVPVKKNSAISARMLVVVAIELGTFFSQYAYSFQSEFITNPLQFRSCYWPNDHHSKAPSVLLFNPDKSFNSFGYRAQRNYFNLLEHDPDKAATYYFVKNFKIQLFNKVCYYILIYSNLNSPLKN